jgi:hypothetical protein
MLETITNIPPINGSLPVLTNHVDSYVSPGNLPIHPTDIDFSKPPLPIINSVSPNFPILVFYSSQLLSDVKTVLDGLVLNLRQTGLQPWILQQEWDREREKTTAVTQGQITQIGRQYSASGWIMPTGDEIEATFKAMEQGVEQDVTASRSIAIANATLEQNNFQFSIGQATQLEGILGNMSVAIQTMLVEEEKTRVLTLTEVNKLNVDVFKTEVDADVAFAQGKINLYQTDTSAYGTMVQAETSKINAQVAVQTAEISYDTKQADLSIEVAKANIATMLSQKEISINTLTTVAKLLAQLVAGYSSSVNFGASVSSSLGYSESDSTSTSFSYPHKPGPAAGGSS